MKPKPQKPKKTIQEQELERANKWRAGNQAILWLFGSILLLQLIIVILVECVVDE